MVQECMKYLICCFRDCTIGNTLEIYQKQRYLIASCKLHSLLAVPTELKRKEEEKEASLLPYSTRRKVCKVVCKVADVSLITTFISCITLHFLGIYTSKDVISFPNKHHLTTLHSCCCSFCCRFGIV